MLTYHETMYILPLRSAPLPSKSIPLLQIEVASNFYLVVSMNIHLAILEHMKTYFYALLATKDDDDDPLLEVLIPQIKTDSVF